MIVWVPHIIITLAAFSGKRTALCNGLVSVRPSIHPSVYPSVCPIFFLILIERAARRLNVTHQGAARDAASVHFRSSTKRTDILILHGLNRHEILVEICDQFYKRFIYSGR